MAGLLLPCLPSRARLLLRQCLCCDCRARLPSALPSPSSRTDEAAEELQSLLEEEALAGIPMLVFANKQDLLNAMPAAEVMKELELTNEKGR